MQRGLDSSRHSIPSKNSPYTAQHTEPQDACPLDDVSFCKSHWYPWVSAFQNLGTAVRPHKRVCVLFFFKGDLLHRQ
jgi:hypothetical protein